MCNAVTGLVLVTFRLLDISHHFVSLHTQMEGVKIQGLISKFPQHIFFSH